MKNIIILASGNGTNYQYITDCISQLNLDINIVALVCDKINAPVVQKANKNKHRIIIRESQGQKRDRYDLELVSDILNLNTSIDLVVLAGWMRILTSYFINAFQNIINLHPALPGQFPGANSIEEAFIQYQEGKITQTGIMVHKVIEELDAGKVIDYIEIPIFKEDTLHLLKKRVQSNEKPLLINSIMKTLNLIDLGRNKLSDLDLDSSIKIMSGKVRDRWNIGYDLVCFFHSDRLSSFDRHICNIDGKGRMLNLINLWWMTNTRHIIENHLLYVSGSYLIAKKCRVIPLEIIVRGYITGNTQTSLWTHYNQHYNLDSKNEEFIYCGLKFPKGYVKNQKLPNPVITPTTKGERDELISSNQILEEGIVTLEELDFIYSKAMQLFSFGSYEADKRGLILVDTKYEFGYDIHGNIILIDEIHTCDSSRYWKKESNLLDFNINPNPIKLDKDAVRDYIKSVCDPYKVEKIPFVPEQQKVKVFDCYRGLYELLTNLKYDEPIISQVKADMETPIIDYYFQHIHSPCAVILSGSKSDEPHIEKLRGHLIKHKIYHREHVCSAHKSTKELLKILDEYTIYGKRINRKMVFITVAGMSNALSGITACNTHYPVVACPPHSDKVDMMTNINSTLQMPSKVPVATILHPENCVIFCKKILN
tara:strand:+ start:962 stop:2917 length:1956 start_codon:yes stop_codon:yes gene_type:complete